MKCRVDCERCREKVRCMGFSGDQQETFNEELKAWLYSQSQNMKLLEKSMEVASGRFSLYPIIASAPLHPETINLILCGFTWMETNQATVQILQTPARRKNLTVPAPNSSFSLSQRMFPANPLLGT